MNTSTRLLVAAAVGSVLIACGSGVVPVPAFTSEPATATTTESPGNFDDAGLALTKLPVAEKNQAIEYDRESGFGPAWADIDQNGCDTRNDILKRDFLMVSTRGVSKCLVIAGQLLDPYTGKTIEFVRGRESSNDVQIDHVVALSDAWRSGQWAASQEERVRLANDPLNLLAVDGPTNTSKSDGDASEWLPPLEAFHCEYVARQIAVKNKYELSVTPGELEAMKTTLRACPGQKMPTE